MKAERLTVAVLAVWVVAFIAQAALLVGIVWVAWHFISKWW